MHPASICYLLVTCHAMLGSLGETGFLRPSTGLPQGEEWCISMYQRVSDTYLSGVYTSACGEKGGGGVAFKQS